MCGVEETLSEIERRDKLVSPNEVNWEAAGEVEGRIKELVKAEKEKRWRGLLAKTHRRDICGSGERFESNVSARR